MSLRDLQKPHLQAAFSPEMFGEEISYNGGDPIYGIFRLMENPDRSRNGSRVQGALQVMVEDVESWSYRDEVTIDGSVWKVLGETGESTWFKHVLKVEQDRRLRL